MPNQYYQYLILIISNIQDGCHMTRFGRKKSKPDSDSTSQRLYSTWNQTDISTLISYQETDVDSKSATYQTIIDVNSTSIQPIMLTLKQRQEI